MKRIFRYAKPFTLAMCCVFFLKFGAAFIELFIPTFLADIIDVGVPEAKEAGTYAPVLILGGKMLAAAVIAMGTNYGANVWSSWITSRMMLRVRQDMFVRISCLSTHQLNDLTAPSAVSRLTSDTYNINSMLLRMMRFGVRAPILLICGMVMTFTLDAPLAMVLLITLPIITVITVILTQKSVPLFAERQKILDRLVRTVQENATGIRVIKALSKTEYEKNRFDGVSAELADQKEKAGLVTALSRPLTNMIFNTGLVVVVFIGAIRVSNGQLQPGRIIAFINYFTIMINATLGIAGMFTTVSHGVASAQRVEELLEIKDEMPILPIPEEEDRHVVEFRHVSFSYHKGSEAKNLDDISLTLDKGQTLGIIGGTGSGKTMLIRLLLRFYDADEGQVLIHGRDIRSIPNAELRKMFGVTLQNDFIAALTIRENIDYFRGLTDEQIERAIEIAQAKEFIAEKEGGLEEMLTIRGNNLSGGQRQRLLIARAVAADPEILILDDASSALDYKTDAALRKSLAENCGDAVKVVIAQRVSSIRHADCILMMDNGSVIGQGTHDELMQTCPAYQEIAAIQMEIETGKEASIHG